MVLGFLRPNFHAKKLLFSHQKAAETKKPPFIILVFRKTTKFAALHH
jgi:hypothetical protein